MISGSGQCDCRNKSNNDSHLQKPKLVCCGANEAPRNCKKPCLQHYCPGISTKNSYRTGVFCDCHKHYRNECGECVELNNCNATCTFEQKLGCMGQFETADGCFVPGSELTCENYRNKKKPQDSKALCILNHCQCIIGTVRDPCGVCVYPENCELKCETPDPQPCRDPNEVHVYYYKDSPNKKCEDADIEKGLCQARCVCRPGYLHNKCKCVQENEIKLNIPCECTNPCPNKNEISSCVVTCQRKNCEFFDIVSKCIPNCRQECECKGGLRRMKADLTSKCVTEDKCKKKKPGT